MNYSVTVANNYLYNIIVSVSTAAFYENQTVAPNSQKTFDNLTSNDGIVFRVPGIGSVNFLGLDTGEISGEYPISGTYGILVRSQNVEGYYRFNEENGALTMKVDQYGTTILSVDSGELIPVSIPELVIKTTDVPVG